MFVLNGNSKDIVEKFRLFGLNQYEARVYFALQVLGKTRAGELWKRSGIPQNKIYLTMDCLVMKGLVENTNLHPREVEAKPFLRFANEFLMDKKSVLAEIQNKIEEYKEVMKNKEKFVRVMV